jgi:hypothetical protein
LYQCKYMYFAPGTTPHLNILHSHCLICQSFMHMLDHVGQEQEVQLEQAQVEDDTNIYPE